MGKAKQEVEEARAKEARARAGEEEAAKVAAAKAYETTMPIVVTQGETTYMNIAEILAAPPPHCPSSSSPSKRSNSTYSYSSST